MQEWFYESAPTIFNTVSLSFSHIRNFVLSVLDSFTFRQTASPAPPGLLDWVRRFWCWLGSWPLRNQLFDSIRQLNILPNTRGVLRTPSVVILDPEVDKPTLEALEELGLHFLAPEIPQSSSTFLRHHGVLKSPYDILAVLNAIVVSSRTITHHSIRFIHAHLVSSLTRRGPISLNSQNKEILRSLPIFPIMPICPGSIGSPAEIGTLSCTDNLCIVSRPTMKILRVGERFLLPIVPVTTFVASSCFGVDCSHVLSVLNATPTSSSTEIDIINLFTTHFALQSKALKRRFLQSLVQHFHDIPSRVLNTIRTIPFIAVGLDGLMKSPESVVDPDSKLADLFHDNDDNLPQIVDSDDALILSYLRSLDLLRSRLSKEVINERVKYITAHQSSLTRKTAVRLLGLLDTTKFDCPGLSNELSAPWLPVLDGFRSPSGCRDLRDQDQALFDRVLSVLHANGLQISSPSLRSALGWDKDIPLTVLKEQLERELDLGTGSVLCNRLDTLLREFGRRVDGIKGTPLENELRQITSRHPWVPVTPNLVVPTSRAFLARALPRFYAVPMSLLSNRGVRIFLSLMGCTEKYVHIVI